jgi:hypothetical protein
MKEVHLKLWQVAHREIIEILDESRHEADWICLEATAAGREDHVWALTAEALAACECRNCALHASLRFWVESRRRAEVELEKLGVAPPARMPNWWSFGPKA